MRSFATRSWRSKRIFISSDITVFFSSLLLLLGVLAWFCLRGWNAPELSRSMSSDVNPNRRPRNLEEVWIMVFGTVRFGLCVWYFLPLRLQLLMIIFCGCSDGILVIGDGRWVIFVLRCRNQSSTRVGILKIQETRPRTNKHAHHPSALKNTSRPRFFDDLCWWTNNSISYRAIDIRFEGTRSSTSKTAVVKTYNCSYWLRGVRHQRIQLVAVLRKRNLGHQRCVSEEFGFS